MSDYTNERWHVDGLTVTHEDMPDEGASAADHIAGELLTILDSEAGQ